MMTMRINSWTSFNASIVSAETGDPDNEISAVLFQQSCPNLTVFVNCLVKLNFTYDKNLVPQTRSSLQISYVIRRVCHESPVEFITQHISTYLGPPCVYKLCEKQHPSYIAMCVHLPFGQLLAESKFLYMFTDCGPPCWSPLMLETACSAAVQAGGAPEGGWDTREKSEVSGRCLEVWLQGLSSKSSQICLCNSLIVAISSSHFHSLLFQFSH